MALPITMTTTDAGNISDRGTYTKAAVADANGNPYYNLGSYYIFFAASGIYGSPYSGWVLGNTLNGSGPGQYDYACTVPGTTVSSFPLTGWSIGGGTPNAPTFTATYAAVAGPTNMTVTIVY